MKQINIPRIEFFGASGVGKTALLRAISRQFLADNNLCLLSDIEASLRRYIGTIGSKEMRAWSDLSEVGLFANKCFSKIANADNTFGQKVVSINLLKSVVERYHVIPLVLPKSKILLADEFLLHRSFALFSSSSNAEADFQWYFDNVPIPSYAVYCYADPETIVERVCNRESTVNSYIYKDRESTLHMLKGIESAYECACSCLRERGVIVRRVSMNESLGSIVTQLKLVLESFVNGSVEHDA